MEHLSVLTDLGDLLAEGMRSQLGVDLALLGSGCIRGETLGPIVTLGDLLEVFPYKNPMIGFNMTGEQLRKAVTFLMRDEAILVEDSHCESFQFSKGFFCEYDSSKHIILKLSMNGEDVKDDDVFAVAAERYYFNTMEENLNIRIEEIVQNGQPIQLAGDAANVLEEYLKSHTLTKKDEEPRLVIK